MSRYIDADALEQKFELYIKSWCGDCNSNAERMVKAYENALYWVKVTPTENVAPRADVAREVFADIEKNLVSIDNFGINQFRCIGARTFAELKKKYESEDASDDV